MATITCTPDCGNSPKMQLIKDFNAAFANMDIDFIRSAVSDDIQWELVGDKVISGRQDFDLELKAMEEYSLAELHMEQIISHGKSAACSGVTVGENGTRYKYCDVYEFTSAKGSLIKSIQSFIVKIS